MAKITKWTEWLEGCSEVSESEGFPQFNSGKEVLLYVTRKLSKKRNESLMEFRGRAWKLYKKDKGINFKNKKNESKTD
ncbi:MAG: hypothetical protein DRJ07_19005 [Bacteroidetes bacterium]|nr:MAG: hypothetical protein DRJ07_19005 [Bacteroidota bacterium]